MSVSGHREFVGRAAGRRSAHARRRGGWWGLAFVVLLFVSEAAVALPETSHPTGYIAAYYRDHETALLIAQAGQLVATVFLFLFARALAATASRPRGGAAVLGSAVLVCLTSVGTNVPVILLAALRTGPRATRTLATWTDRTDVILMAAVALFGVACAWALPVLWARLAAAALAIVAAVDTVLAAGGSDALAAVAPLAFLAFVAVLAVALLRSPRARGRSR